MEISTPVPLTLYIFRLPTIRLRALVLFFIWFSVSLCYYGITYFVPNLYGDKYLNTILGRNTQVPNLYGDKYLNTILGRNTQVPNLYGDKYLNTILGRYLGTQVPPFKQSQNRDLFSIYNLCKKKLFLFGFSFTKGLWV